MRKGSVLDVAFNSPGAHAEAALRDKCLRSGTVRRRGLRIVVVRLDVGEAKRGVVAFRNSRPCASCSAMLRDARLGVTCVIWTGDEGAVHRCKPHRL